MQIITSTGALQLKQAGKPEPSDLYPMGASPLKSEIKGGEFARKCSYSFYIQNYGQCGQTICYFLCSVLATAAAAVVFVHLSPLNMAATQEAITTNAMETFLKEIY